MRCSRCCLQGSTQLVDAVASFRNLNLGAHGASPDSSSSDDEEADRFRHSNSDDEVEFGSQKQVLTVLFYV